MKELSKNIQDLKTEVETTKKLQRETTLEIENPGKKSGALDANINNRIQEIEERISDAEDTIETIALTVKQTAKCKNLVTQNIQEIQDTMRRPNLRIIGIDESENLQLKGPANIFNKIMEENFPNLKRDAHEFTRSLQNSKHTEPEQKYFPSLNNQNIKCTKQRKNIKGSKRKIPSNIERKTYQNHTRLLTGDHES